jgi:hypothetical protein
VTLRERPDTTGRGGPGGKSEGKAPVSPYPILLGRIMSGVGLGPFDRGRLVGGRVPHYSFNPW